MKKRLFIFIFPLFLVGAGCMDNSPEEQTTNTVPTVSETSNEAESEWRTFTHATYNYQFSYPSLATVEAEGLDPAQAATARTVHVLPYITIEALPADEFTDNPEHSQALKQTIQIYAQSIHHLNPQASALSPTTIGGVTGFMFSTSGTYKDFTREGVLFDNREHTFVFLEQKGLKYILEYATDDPDAQKIVQSFQFNK